MRSPGIRIARRRRRRLLVAFHHIDEQTDRLSCMLPTFWASGPCGHGMGVGSLLSVCVDRFIKKIRAALEAYTKRARHVCEHFLQTTTIISRYMSSPMMTRVGMKHIKKYVEMMTHDNVSRVNGSASTNGSGSVNGVQAAVNGAADCDHVASGAADENEGSDKPNNVARW